jgi:hypothetical protein
MKRLFITIILLAIAGATLAAPAAKHKKPRRQTQKKPKEQILSVRVFTPRFVQPNHVYDFRLPITVRVNADDARALNSVRVRLFPNKDLKTVKRTYLELTQSGCRILNSRVETYMPTFQYPDIDLQKVLPMEMRCDANWQYLEPTPFVLVIESDDGDENRFLRIGPKVVDSYFRKAYSFTVKPAPHQACVTKPEKSMAATEGALVSEADTIARREIAERDSNRNSCVKVVK